MANRALVGQLISFYYDLDDIAKNMAGNVDIEYVVAVKNVQTEVDKLLTNISKRWASGNRLPGYIPVRFIVDDDPSVQVNTTPL